MIVPLHILNARIATTPWMHLITAIILISSILPRFRRTASEQGATASLYSPLLPGDGFGSSIIPIRWVQSLADIEEFGHVPAGPHVLYPDDGRVEFLPNDLNASGFSISPVSVALFGRHPSVAMPDCVGSDNHQES